jgi:peroxiredoxin
MSTGFWVSYVLLWAIALFSTLLLLGVLRTVYGRQAQAAPDDPAPATERRPAPELVATDLHGRPFVSDGWRHRRTAVLFVSPDCDSCKLTLPQLSALHRKVHGNVVVVCRSVTKRCAQMAEEYELDVPVLVDSDHKISERFGVDIAPTAVLVDADGMIESLGHPMGVDDLEEMFGKQNGARAIAAEGLDVVQVGGQPADDDR